MAELGKLHLKGGDLISAETIFNRTLAVQPDYPHVVAGLASITAAQGDHTGAAALLESVVAAQPLPEFTLKYSSVNEPTSSA